MLEKTEEIIKNEQSRDIDNIKLARHGTNTKKNKNTTHNISNSDPTYKTGVNPCAWQDTLCCYS